jgi:hypothetical protein
MGTPGSDNGAEPRPVLCEGCGRKLAEQAEGAIVFRNAIVRQMVTFACGRCGHQHVWQPRGEQ